MAALVSFLLLAIALPVAIRRPGLALAVALMAHGIEQLLQANLRFFATHQSAFNYYSATLVIVALCGSFLRGHLSKWGSPSYLLTLALFLWASATAVWTTAPEQTSMVLRTSLPYALLYLLLVPALASDEDVMRDFLWTTVLLGACVAALLAFTADWDGRTIVLLGGSTDPHATAAGNPLAVATMAGRVAVAAFLLHSSSRAWRVGKWLAIAVSAWAIVESGSRGQAIAVVIAPVVLLTLTTARGLTNKKNYLAALIGAALLAGVGVAMIQVVDPTGSRWGFDTMVEVQESTRSAMSHRVLRYWLETGPVQWIAGLGTGASYRPDILGIYPHVVPVEVLVETGLVGFSIFVMLMVAYARSVWRTLSQRNTALGVDGPIIALVLFGLALSLKQGNLWGNMPTFGLLAVSARAPALIRKRLSNNGQAEQGNQCVPPSDLEFLRDQNPRPTSPLAQLYR